MNISIIISITNFWEKLIPDSDVTNIWWWLSIAITFVIGVVVYVSRQWITSKVLSILPRPRVFLYYEGKRVSRIVIPKCENFDTSSLYAERLKDSMEAIKRDHPLMDLDVFHNMHLCIPGEFEAAQCYNEDVQGYYNSMNQYFQNTIADELTSSFIIPLQFVLYANTSRACNNLHITLNQTGSSSLFSPDSKRQVSSKRDVPPVYENYKGCEGLNALFDNDSKEYSYNKWDLRSAGKEYKYENEKLVGGMNDLDTIKPFYIDIRNKATYEIKWKINGEDISAKGISGSIIIEVK